MTTVLLLCTTNFTRSPLFEAIFQKHIQEHGLEGSIAVTSRGTFAGSTSRPIERRMRERSEAVGISLDHHMTRQVTVQDIAAATHIVTLDEDSYWFVRREVPDYPQHRVRLASEYGSDLGIREIPEPVTGQGSYEMVINLAQQLAPMIFEKIWKESRVQE